LNFDSFAIIDMDSAVGGEPDRAVAFPGEPAHPSAITKIQRRRGPKCEQP